MIAPVNWPPAWTEGLICNKQLRKLNHDEVHQYREDLHGRRVRCHFFGIRRPVGPDCRGARDYAVLLVLIAVVLVTAVSGLETAISGAMSTTASIIENGGS
jgi:Flp pilus assembly pilin Flp